MMLDRGELLKALRAFKRGDFAVRMPLNLTGIDGEIAQTFNDVASAVIAHHGRGRIEYVPFPPGLRGSYQSNTQADISALRASGCDVPFLTVEQGVSRYLKELGS